LVSSEVGSSLGGGGVSSTTASADSVAGSSLGGVGSARASSLGPSATGSLGGVL
jgi:hypothetical protein